MGFPLPPLFRFLVELATWIYFIIAGFWYLTLISVASFSLMNYPGDKKAKDAEMPGILLKGYQRIVLEFFWGWFSVIIVFLYFDTIYFVIQFLLVVVSEVLDKDRYYWMLGRRAEAPEYVTAVHK